MDKGAKIAIVFVLVAGLAAGGYFYWKSKQDGDYDGYGEDTGTDTDGGDKADKLVAAETTGNKLDTKPQPRTHVGDTPIAEIKTSVMLPSGTYFVDRNKVLYYDGINPVWPKKFGLNSKDVAGQPYNPDTIKMTFLPMNFATGELQPTDMEKLDKYLARYKKDLADLDRQWGKIKWPVISGQKVMAFGGEQTPLSFSATF